MVCFDVLMLNMVATAIALPSIYSYSIAKVFELCKIEIVIFIGQILLCSNDMMQVAIYTY